MYIEIDILGKKSDSILVKEEEQKKTPEAEKPKGFDISKEFELELVIASLVACNTP